MLYIYIYYIVHILYYIVYIYIYYNSVHVFIGMYTCAMVKTSSILL